MDICVFGAGSSGSALGGMLARRNSVTLIARAPHVRAIRRGGLVLQGDVRDVVRLPAFSDVADVDPPELLLIATKSYDTQSAIEECRAWLPRGASVLTLQNGLGNLEALREWKGSRAIGGTTTMGSTMVSPGKIRISGLGRTVIGSELDPAFAKRVVKIFTSCGIPCRFSDDVVSEIWMKVIVSACINPLTAVLRVPNGKLLESDPVKRMTLEVSRECERVAAAEGVKLPVSRTYPRVRSVAKDTARNLSSMLQDIMRGRRTEIDQINGAICKLAEQHGLDVPLNKTLTAMVRSMMAE